MITRKNITIAAGGLGLFLVTVAAVSLICTRESRHFDRDGLTANPSVYGQAGSGAVTVETPNGLSPLTIAIDEPGDTELLPDVSVLLTGRDSQADEGVIILARPDAFGAYSVKDTFGFPGRDLVGCAFDPSSSMIYVLDCEGAEILEGSYAGGDLLPTAWTVFADTTHLPELSGLQDYWLDFDDDTDVLVLSHHRDPGYFNTYELPVSNPGSGGVSELGSSNNAYFKTQTVVVGQTSVELVGPASTAVSILRISDSTIVGSGITDTLGAATISTLPLALGEVYGSQSSMSGTPGRYITPTKHWGPADPFPSGATIEPFDSDIGLMAYVDNEVFSVHLRSGDPNGGEPGASYTAYLVIGTPSDVQLFQGTHVLASAVNIPTTLPFTTSGEKGFVGVDLPLPDDPATAGVELAFQWWIIVGQEFVLSDIVGVVIRDLPFIPPGAEWWFGVSASQQQSQGGGGSSLQAGRANKQRILPNSPATRALIEALASKAGGHVNPALTSQVIRNVMSR